VDSLQRILVEHEEWYEHLKFNKIETNDFFNDNFKELNKKFALGGI